MVWTKVGCTLGPVHMGSQVLSATHVSKSQHGGKVPTFEPHEPMNIYQLHILTFSHMYQKRSYLKLPHSSNAFFKSVRTSVLF